MSPEEFAQRIPSGVYEHYKGGRYLVLGLGRDDESDEVVVIYTRLYHGEGIPLTVRRASKFIETVSTEQGEKPRFRHLGILDPHW